LKEKGGEHPMRIPFMKQLSWYLAVTMFILAIAPRVDAGFAPSEMISLVQSDRTEDLARIQNLLETKIVRERLDALGFSQDEIQGRLSQLTDQELHRLATQIDSLSVGGDAAGVIIAVLVIIILIIVILQLTGHKVLVTK
jgi:hypothetical protein